ELLPFAEQTYHELEKLLQISIYHSRNVIRTFANVKEENDWLAHSAQPGYEKYVANRADIGNYKHKTTPAFGYGEVQYGAQVNLPLLMSEYHNFLIINKQILEEVFDYEQLIIGKSSIRYKNITADKIIFCEGAKAKANPYFNYLPFHGDKGEALIVRIPEAGFEKMLKQQIFIVPLGNDDLYWVGSTYNPRYTDELPSESGKSYLLQHLQHLLKIPFEVLDHVAAVRPTVRDRRPFLGLHPQFPQLGIFNGLGTKGASLGPFFAHHFMQFLLGLHPLDDSVDIRRFS
ncbi:MAG: FAD-dependent oxidoreductase, partial [Saprospiraceae bacterium]